MAKKLLLAEDSLTIQKVFALTFQLSNISLTTVDNGEDAVRLAGEISPDLVVADVTLPDRDGFDVASALRGLEATRSCPILILAGSLPPFDEEKFRKCGADGVLFKPFESQELIDKVEALLRGGEVPAEAPPAEAAAGAEELWDFSDILEEVDEETGREADAASSQEGLLPGSGGMTGRLEEMGSLGEFDVSLEEIARDEGLESVRAEETVSAAAMEDTAPVVAHAEDTAPVVAHAEDTAPVVAPAEDTAPVVAPAEDTAPVVAHAEDTAPVVAPAEDTAPVVAPAEESAPVVGHAEEILPMVSHAEDLGFDDSPPAVTDLTPAIEAAGGLQMEETKETVAEAPEAAPEVLDDPLVPAAAVQAAPDTPSPAEERLREEFSERVREILERVAADTVEKVMWEMMDRLSADITEKIRETVEAVAWDVIPATAESVIREEIERIRTKTGE